jgi:hypothetical protein
MADFKSTYFGSQNSEPAQVPWDITSLNTKTQSLSYGLKAKQREIDEFYQKADADTQGRKTGDPMTSNLSRQIAHITNMGYYARPTRFAFIIDGLLWRNNDRLNRNCQTLSLPGRSVASQPIKIYGPPKEFVYEANYENQLTILFRVGEDMFERDFFEQWMNTSISLRSSDLSYPDDYMTSMRVFQLDRTDNYLYCVQLYNVFCKSISQIDLGSDLSDQIETVSVVLGYSEYQVIGHLKDIIKAEVPTPVPFTERKTNYPGSGKDVLGQADQQMFGNKVLNRDQDQVALDNILNSSGLFGQ